MRLENVIALTNGEIVNSPFVTKFSNIRTDAKNIKHGDLYIAFDNQEIDDAIAHGAYGIVFCNPTQISDSEIAWIKVSNIEKALKRLIRFKLVEKNITAYSTNNIIINLALQVITENNFIVLSKDTKTTFNQLLDLQENDNILFCPTLTDKDLFTNIKNISSNTTQAINIVEQTLFETSFIYDNIFYERQLLSPFFIPYLEILLHFFKVTNIKYRLRKFTQINNFEPVFVNKKLQIKEFGSSEMVLIFENEVSLVDKEIIFLENEATWAKKIYIIPNSINLDINKDNILKYESQNDIIDILKNNKFHFALIIGVSKSILENNILKKQEISLLGFLNE
jgi:ferrochelatase